MKKRATILSNPSTWILIGFLILILGFSGGCSSLSSGCMKGGNKEGDKPDPQEDIPTSEDYTTQQADPNPACVPNIEIADGKDNDCDGQRDEEDCGPTELGDGVDNDGDGDVDEGCYSYVPG